MKQILLATTNPGKLLEYRELFKEFDIPLELRTLKDEGITGDPVEDGETFEANAIKKLEFYSKQTTLPILAEDSGLEIDYLNGEPGVYSRRWPGYEASDEELLAMLFKKMKGVQKERRGAQFRVVLGLQRPHGVAPILVDGIIRGTIAEEPSENIVTGFPFRSLFYVPEVGKIIGEMTMEEEVKVMHRRIALKKLLLAIKKL